MSEIRTGLGWDVHRTAAGRQLILGGVAVPCEFGLEGHSDADVLCHAIADAVLPPANEPHDLHSLRTPEGRRVCPLNKAASDVSAPLVFFFGGGREVGRDEGRRGGEEEGDGH